MSVVVLNVESSTFTKARDAKFDMKVQTLRYHAHATLRRVVLMITCVSADMYLQQVFKIHRRVSNCRVSLISFDKTYQMYECTYNMRYTIKTSIPGIFN